MLRPSHVGGPRGLLVTRRLMGTAEPVAGAPEADRRRHRCAEMLEVPGGADRIVHPGQRDEARDPLGVGIVSPGAAEVLRGDRVGFGDLPVLERLPRQIGAALHPKVGSAKRLGRGRLLAQVVLGLLPAPLLDPVEIALEGEAGVVPEARRHLVDQVLQPRLVAAHGDAGAAERLPVGVDQRQHRLGLAGQTAPEQHVEPRL